MSTTADGEEPKVEMEVDGEGDGGDKQDSNAATADATADTTATATATATTTATSTEDATTVVTVKGPEAETGDDVTTAKTDDDQKDNGASSTDNNTKTDDKTDDDKMEARVSGKKRPRSPSESSSNNNQNNNKEDEGVNNPESKKHDAAIVAMLEVKKTTEASAAKEKDYSNASSAATTTRDSEKISVASVAAASQLSAAMGWNGLGSLLSLSLLTNNGNSNTLSSNDRSNRVSNRTSTGTGTAGFSSVGPSGGGSSNSSSSNNNNNNTGTLPSKEQVLQASIKAVNDAPPFVHLSKTDSAPQLKITDSACAVGTDATTGTTSRNDTATTAAAAAETPAATDTDTDTDTTASLLVNDRLACKQAEGEMRGYRMSRASHGVTPGAGHFYYEVVILPPPTARELVKSLPPNVRLGKKLQREMEEALKAEEEEEQREQRENLANENNETTTTTPSSSAEKEKVQGESTSGASPSKPSKAGGRRSSSSNSNSNSNNNNAFGAHVRLGWSMRTGDLQAPVGYDKWSYGIRDIMGSKTHCSRRDDNWGGEEFGPGDVVGCAISMVSDGTTNTEISAGGETATANADATSANANNNINATKDSSNAATGQDKEQLQPKANENHIRFFKNGLPMGEFVITKGKREGGAAFIIPDGVYYPAISLYMGATVKVNFGPHFIHPPRKLPSSMSSKSSKKKGGGGSNSSATSSSSSSSFFQPVSNVCKAPLSVEESSAKVVKELKTLFFRKADNTAQQKRFLELVETEVQVQRDAYQNHRWKHVLDVIEERKLRNLKCDDLEHDEFFGTTGAFAAATSGGGGTTSSSSSS